MMPERTSMRSNSGHERRNSRYSSSVQKPITRSIPGAVVPATVEEHQLPGRGQVGDVALEIPLRLLTLGRRQASATTRADAGFSGSVIVLIAPPLPAASRPSNTMHHLQALRALIHSWSLTSSMLSFASSSSYDVGILQCAKHILQSDDLLDHIGRLVPQHVLKELQRVAQPFTVDTQGMVGRQRGRLDDRFVGAHDLVPLEDEARTNVSHLVRPRLTRWDRQLACAGGGEERAEPVDETAVGAAVEMIEHVTPSEITARVPILDQRLNVTLDVSCHFNLVLFGLDKQHVQIPHCTQHTARPPEVLVELIECIRLEVRSENLVGCAHPPGGHTHVVQRLDVLTQPRPGFIGEHLKEVRQQCLTAGLAHWISWSQGRNLDRRRPDKHSCTGCAVGRRDCRDGLISRGLGTRDIGDTTAGQMLPETAAGGGVTRCQLCGRPTHRDLAARRVTRLDTLDRDRLVAGSIQRLCHLQQSGQKEGVLPLLRSQRLHGRLPLRLDLLALEGDHAR
jgi:hypothetical protein